MMKWNENLNRLQRSGIRRYTNLAAETKDCIKLAIGEPEFDTPAAIKDAAVAALTQNRTHYAPNQGVAALREKIAAFETRRGMVCRAEQVLITAGATGALFTALLGILQPGDEVIIPTPAFPLYESIVLMAGAKPVYLDTKKDNFQLTEAALGAVISEKTRAIILNSPNNPTGVVLSQQSLAAVKEAVLGKDIFVVCDNVYQGLSTASIPDLSVDAQLKEQLFLCQSFSKPYAMTGWRVGYLVGPECVMERLLLLHAAQVASIPTFLQDACIVALDVDVAEMAKIYEKRREYVCRRLTEMGLAYPEPQGAFYIFPDISDYGLPDEEFCTQLIRQGGVAAVPGSCFGCEGHIRISYCCADEQLEIGMDRLEAFLKRQ